MPKFSSPFYSSMFRLKLQADTWRCGPASAMHLAITVHDINPKRPKTPHVLAWVQADVDPPGRVAGDVSSIAFFDVGADTAVLNQGEPGGVDRGDERPCRAVEEDAGKINPGERPTRGAMAPHGRVG
jgi:hypothetical protein